MIKPSAIVFVIVVVAVICSSAETGATARRDEALRKVDACLKRNEMMPMPAQIPSPECKNINQTVETLMDVYRTGDKSVLPTLFKFTYLTEFYDEALLNDPDGFLTAMNRLPGKQRREVAIAIAGGYFTPLQKPKFELLRSLLTSIPKSSPVNSVSRTCLTELETNNASLFLNYFPPQTFTSGAADIQTFNYSRDLYALGERPLWPPVSGVTVYRITHLASFDGPESATLTVLPDGTGVARIKALNSQNKVEIEDSRTVSAEGVNRFFVLLGKADYLNVPTEMPSNGIDGAEWILEGVQNGQYHVVVRWCPGIESRDPQVLAFADAARLLLEFAGHKYNHDC